MQLADKGHGQALDRPWRGGVDDGQERINASMHGPRAIPVWSERDLPSLRISINERRVYRKAWPVRRPWAQQRHLGDSRQGRQLAMRLRENLGRNLEIRKGGFEWDACRKS